MKEKQENSGERILKEKNAYGISILCLYEIFNKMLPLMFSFKIFHYNFQSRHKYMHISHSQRKLL